MEEELSMDGDSLEDDEGNNPFEECFGEYGISLLCKECPYAKKCKKFQDTEWACSREYKGKYTGKGKFRARDRY